MPDEIKRNFSGSKFEEMYGHCRAVSVGDLIFVAGTTGYDYATGEISDDPAAQTHKTIDNIDAALRDLGSSFADVVKIVTYFVEQDDWDAIGGALRKRLAGVHPANSGVRTGLILPEMKVEISAIAARRS